jgi:hypothetical protein
MNLPSLLLASMFAAVFVHGEAVKDREGAVRKDRATMEFDSRWVYNDIGNGFAAASVPASHCSLSCDVCRAFRAWGSTRACWGNRPLSLCWTSSFVCE